MNAYRWEDLAVGLRHEFQVLLTADMIHAFAALSGDSNPLHLDAGYAASAGYPGPIAHGLLTSSFYSRLVGVHLPGRHALLHGIDVDLVSPVYAGDTLRVTGEITYLTDAYHRLELRGTIAGPQGKLVSRAKIRVGLHVP